MPQYRHEWHSNNIDGLPVENAVPARLKKIKMVKSATYADADIALNAYNTYFLLYFQDRFSE